MLLRYDFLLFFLISTTLNYCHTHAEAAIVPGYDAAKFISSCQNLNGSLPCKDYKCLQKYHELDVRQLGQLLCHNDADCKPELTGFECVNHEYLGQSYCECPRYHGYNATHCQCQPVARCNHHLKNETCHLGMVCPDQMCSCNNLEKTLFTATGRFCVLPPAVKSSGSTAGIYNDNNENNTWLGWTVSCIVLICLLIGFLCIVIYVLLNITCCKKGDYEPDEHHHSEHNFHDKDQHVAAWDLPSMDYLGEEETLKYIKKHERDRELASMSTVSANSASSTSPSPSGGSVPESEQSMNRMVHINQAYVHDNGSEYSTRRTKS